MEVPITEENSLLACKDLLDAALAKNRRGQIEDAESVSDEITRLLNLNRAKSCHNQMWVHFPSTLDEHTFQSAVVMHGDNELFTLDDRITPAFQPIITVHFSADDVFYGFCIHHGHTQGFLVPQDQETIIGTRQMLIV